MFGKTTKSVLAGVAKLVDQKEDNPDVDLALATLWGIGLMHLVLEERTDAQTQQLLDRFLARVENDLRTKRTRA